jgi:hypothetical protein
MLVLWYGAILLWVYDPLLVEIVIAVVACGVLYKMWGLPIGQ